MHKDNATPETSRAEIVPVLDDALTRLNDTERHALLLRFFEKKGFKDVPGRSGSASQAPAGSNSSIGCPKGKMDWGRPEKSLSVAWKSMPRC